MADFPRTIVGGVSISRMLIGTNWFFGYSHQTRAKDDMIKSTQSDEKIAEIMAVFLKAGIDGLIAPTNPRLKEIIPRAEDLAGRKVIPILTPNFPITPDNPGNDEVKKVLDETKALGAVFCLPHQCTTDTILDKLTRQFRYYDTYAKLIRERGMLPGLSTHDPSSIVIADESGADVETYIAIYNAAGFLMQIEIDWVMRVISQAKKPVLTIKPLAAGRIEPAVGLPFVWNTIRDCDMVAIGCMTPDEAREVIDLSHDFLNKRIPDNTLQETRSKQALKKKK